MLGHLGLGPALPLRQSEQITFHTRNSGYKVGPRSLCPPAREGHTNQGGRSQGLETTGESTQLPGENASEATTHTDT